MVCHEFHIFVFPLIRVDLFFALFKLLSAFLDHLFLEWISVMRSIWSGCFELVVLVRLLWLLFLIGGLFFIVIVIWMLSEVCNFFKLLVAFSKQAHKWFFVIYGISSRWKLSRSLLSVRWVLRLELLENRVIGLLLLRLLFISWFFR